MHAHAETSGVELHIGATRKVAVVTLILNARLPGCGNCWMARRVKTRRPCWRGLSTELIEDRIYVLTPQGQVIDLPKGGTVLDFAYHVHTEVGHRCQGAKVNGRIVPLSFQPSSGDRIEILTGKVSEPRRDWLMAGSGFLASARARDKVRAHFHKLDQARNLQAGKDLLDRELKRLALLQLDLSLALPKLKLQRVDELYLAVALGDFSPSQVARALA
jgi:GTP pyrophosphokinase